MTNRNTFAAPQRALGGRRSANSRFAVRNFGTLAVTLALISMTASCRIPYKYKYEQKTGVGITDRANDYCRRSSANQGYKFVRTVGPMMMDKPGELNVRMQLADGSGDLNVSCQFDDSKRTAIIPRPQRNSSTVKGYASGDAKQARTICERAVKSSGYTVRDAGTPQWLGERQYRVNVGVQQSGVERIVACRFDAVPGTASVPQVTP